MNVVAPCLAALVVAGAGKAITFSTKSAEARAAALDTVKRIESLQGGPGLQATARKAVEADPGFAFGHYLVGVTLPSAQGKPHLEKAVELSKSASDGERRYIEAAMLNRSQKPKEALAALEALRRDYPGERMVHMMLGQVKTAEGKLEQAKAAYEKAIALDGSTARVYAFLGNVETLRGAYGKARAHYTTALAKRAPGTAPGQVHFGLAMTHLYENDVEGALAAMQTFLVEYRKSPGTQPEVFIWNAMARMNLEHGRLEAALDSYEKGFESVPGSSLDERQKKIWLGRLHHGRGRALARMGRHEEAWKEAETVKKMIDEGGEEAKEFVPAWQYLAGYVKLEAGDAAAALEHLKQADQDDSFVQLLLARAYEKAGDTAAARKAYQAVIDSKQNNLDRALAYSEARRKLATL